MFTVKLVKGEVLPMAKKAWAVKFKKYARLAGINEPKMNCHGVRKACRGRGLCGRNDPAHDGDVQLEGREDAIDLIAKADRERLGFDGMSKLIAYDQMQNIVDLTMPEDENRIVTFESNRRKNPEISTPNVEVVRSEDSNPHGVTHCHLKAARLPIPPRALWDAGWNP